MSTRPPGTDPHSEPPDDDPSYVIVLYVGAGCLLFIAIAIAAPAAYHYTQPAEHYFNVDDLTITLATHPVDETRDDPCTIQIQTRYWAREALIVSAETTLYRHGNESLVEARVWRDDGYLPSGVHAYETTRRVDAPLEEGTYHFEIVVTFPVSRFGFEKEHTVESEPFKVVHGEPAASRFQRTQTHLVYPERPRCAPR